MKTKKKKTAKKKMAKKITKKASVNKKVPRKKLSKSKTPRAKGKARKTVKKRLPRPRAEFNLQGLADERLKVAVKKFETTEPTPESKIRRREITLSPSYGDNKIVAMVRDPWWIYTYWEITPMRDMEVKRQMGAEGAVVDSFALRVHDITGIEEFNGTNANSYYDIRLTGMAQNWYIDVSKPNRSWCVDIGILAKDKRFYVIARSNYVHTPRFGMSEVMDEEWMCPEEDYWQLFGISGGFGIGKSSMEIKQMFKKHFQEWISSGAVSSFSSFVLSSRG